MAALPPRLLKAGSLSETETLNSSKIYPNRLKSAEEQPGGSETKISQPGLAEFRRCQSESAGINLKYIGFFHGSKEQ